MVPTVRTQNIDYENKLNRRLYPRKKIIFPTLYIINGETKNPSYGLDFGGGGLLLLTQEPIIFHGNYTLSIIAIIENKRISCDATLRWSTTIQTPNGLRYKYGLKIRTIKDLDWDHIMQESIKGSSLVAGKMLTSWQRDQMLPPEKQHLIAQELSKNGRLSYDAGQKLPLIAYTFEKYTMKNGVPYYLFKIRSRIVGKNSEQFFTQVLVSIEYNNIRIITN